MKKAAVMYSGGVDSLVVADIAANSNNDEIYLITCVTKCHSKIESVEQLQSRMNKKIEMLKRKHVNKNFKHIFINTVDMHKYLYNKHRVRELFSIGIWRTQLCACCSSAMIFCTLIYCINNKIDKIYNGANIMMSIFPYQGIECVDLLDRFAQKYKIQFLTPIYWYENEDVMLLYQFDDFRDNEYIQSNIIRNCSTNRMANKEKLAFGEMKYNFKNKNATQILCEYEVFINYSMLLFFYRKYNFSQIQNLMYKHLKEQIKNIEPVLNTYLNERNSYGE